MKTAFFCDRRKDCSGSPLCGSDCQHTADPEHALYATHEDFDRVGDILWERKRRPNDGAVWVGGEKMKRVLVVGLRGHGKSTYVRNHLGKDGLAYDMDAIASAFRMRQPHEEYHAQARRMANDFLSGFLFNVHEYTHVVYIIRTAPSIDEASAINPDEIIWCNHEYVRREMDDRLLARERIETLFRWARDNHIPARILD